MQSVLRSAFSLLVVGSCFALPTFSQPVSKPDYIHSPEMELINKPNVADAYPFLSADGLRLYFTTNREGGHGRLYYSRRKTIRDKFEKPQPLSKKLPDGFYAGSLTADELTLCMVNTGKVYISQRKNKESEFGTPVLVPGIREGYHFGPAISPDGLEIIVMFGATKDESVLVYRRQRTEDISFKDMGELPLPAKSHPGPGQFSKDGLSYYFSIENNLDDERIWRYSRTSVKDRFVDLEELPITINAAKRNFQPTSNGDGSIIIHTTSQSDTWEEDDLVLVNDEKKQLTAPEQFASVETNSQTALAVKSKVALINVKAYPNPFQANIILEMDQQPEQNTFFTLYDLTGKMIRQQRVTNMKTSITLENLPMATYIYQLVDGNKRLVASGKLVKGG